MQRDGGEGEEIEENGMAVAVRGDRGGAARGCGAAMAGDSRCGRGGVRGRGEWLVGAQDKGISLKPTHQKHGAWALTCPPKLPARAIGNFGPYFYIGRGH